MNTPYLEDIPLETAQNEFRTLLKLNNLITILEDEVIPLDENAVNRVLSTSIYSPESSPNFHASAMDGFAVRSHMTLGSLNGKPSVLSKKDFMYVDTGDPLPEWADSVIPIENIEAYDSNQKISTNMRRPERIQVRSTAVPWQHVRAMGEDIVSSQLLFPRGHILRPIDLGALAACGISILRVARRPMIAVIPTGTELVPIGKKAKHGELIEFNSIVLAAMVNQWGGIAKRYSIVPDDLVMIKNQVQIAAQESDLILLNAGSSAGSEDFSAEVIQSIGKVIVHGIAVRPGHPVILGYVNSVEKNSEIRKVPIIGVPGYPVSAALTAELFVEPLIAAWTGRLPHEPEEVSARITKKVISPSGDTDILRVVVGKVGDEILCAPLAKGAGTVTSLVKADGLIMIPPGIQGISAGEVVKVKLYSKMKTLQNTIFAIGSHDITLDLLSQKLAEYKLRLVSSNVGSQGGLISLNKREAHMAGTHLLDSSSGIYNQKFIKEYIPDQKVYLMHWVNREQGLIVKKGNPKSICSLADLANSDIKFINRQRGSGTRLLFDYNIGQMNLHSAQIKGYLNEEYTHLGVAVAVASGRADCGLGITSAANALDLDFVPLYYEQYDFALLDTESTCSLMNILEEISQDAKFQAEIVQLGGYDVSQIGKILMD